MIIDEIQIEINIDLLISKFINLLTEADIESSIKELIINCKYSIVFYI